MSPSPRALLAAAALSFTVALVHLIAIFAGPAAYAFLQAPQLGHQEAAGSWIPDLMTAGLVVVFGVFGLYALSGAGRARRLPALPYVLAGIGAIYALRGLVFVPQVVILVRGAPIPPRFAFFSLASLVIGIAYLVGAVPLLTRRRAEAGA